MSKRCEGHISLISALEQGKIRLIIDVDMESPGYFSDDGVLAFEISQRVEVIERP